MAKSGKARSQTVKNRKKDKIDFAQRFMWVLTVFFLALFPLLFDSTKYGKLTRAKFTYFAAAALICIIVLILYYISAVLVGAKKMPDLKKALARTSFAQKAMAAYLLIAVISAIFSQYTDSVWMGYKRYDGLYTTLLYGALFFFASASGKFQKAHIVAIGISMTLYAVIGILQLFNIDILHLYAKNRYFLNSHFVTTSGNIDFVSGTLCIMLPILCGAVVLLRDRWRWFLLIPVALCMLLAIQINVDAFYVGIFGAFLISIPFWVREKESLLNLLLLFAVLFVSAAAGVGLSITYTTTDGSGVISCEAVFEFSRFVYLLLGAAAVFVILYLIFRLLKGRFHPKPKHLTIVLVTLMVLILLAGIFLVWDSADKPERGTLYQAGQILFRGHFGDNYGSGRSLVWKLAVPMALRVSPIIGTGPGTFYQIFNEYNKAVLEVANIQTFDSAHNDYIQILCNCGLLGLIAYLCVLFGLAVAAIKNAQKDPMILILGAAVLCYSIQVFFSFTIVIVTPMFFMCLGLLDGHCRRCRGEQNGLQK